jgi:FAD/FMN-containing dehydrogenase
MSDFTGLSIDGRIATAADPDWDEARAAWNLIADQQPAAVALVESGDDIAEVVRFAAANDLRVAGQGTGHGAAALASSLDGAILIKTERMRAIEVDPGVAAHGLFPPDMVSAVLVGAGGTVKSLSLS